MSAPHDLRSPLAKARDAFLVGADKGGLSDATTLGAPREAHRYLANRLESAWLEGVKYGEAHPKKARAKSAKP